MYMYMYICLSLCFSSLAHTDPSFLTHSHTHTLTHSHTHRYSADVDGADPDDVLAAPFARPVEFGELYVFVCVLCVY
jgi:hypothetical protein